MGLLEDVCFVGITGNGQQHRSEYILQKKKKELHTFTNVLKFHHTIRALKYSNRKLAGTTAADKAKKSLLQKFSETDSVLIGFNLARQGGKVMLLFLITVQVISYVMHSLSCRFLRR